MPISNFSLGEARIKADTIHDAKKVAKDYGFNKVINITKMWVQAGKPLGPRTLKAFEIDTLMARKKWRKQGIGFGFLISLAPKIHDRKLVYTQTPYKKTIKRSEMERIYEIKLSSDDTLVGQAKKLYESKALCKKLAKKYKESTYLTLVYRPVQPNRRIFECFYQEAKGEYLVFGCVENKSELKEIKINV